LGYNHDGIEKIYIGNVKNIDTHCIYLFFISYQDFYLKKRNSSQKSLWKSGEVINYSLRRPEIKKII